jgi:hypothetical protein
VCADREKLVWAQSVAAANRQRRTWVVNMARQAAWFAGGLCGAAIAAAVSLYALGLEMVGEDARDRRGEHTGRPDVRST